MSATNVLAPLIFVCCALGTVGSPFARAVEPPALELNSLRLYVPKDELENRLGKDATPIGEYIKSLTAAAGRFLEKQAVGDAKGIYVAVGPKEGRKSRAWCEAVDGTIAPDLLRKLQAELAKVPTLDLKNGPVAFALELKLRGRQPAKFPEVPAAWLDAIKKSDK